MESQLLTFKDFFLNTNPSLSSMEIKKEMSTMIQNTSVPPGEGAINKAIRSDGSVQ